MTVEQHLVLLEASCYCNMMFFGNTPPSPPQTTTGHNEITGFMVSTIMQLMPKMVQFYNVYVSNAPLL